jgi:hypothetical protein
MEWHAVPTKGDKRLKFLSSMKAILVSKSALLTP